ncbi:MAG: FAD-dependent oxidoreductase [Kiritimatiellaeota bacterium]|nr:FAD-dependent oxidoreductase [Kiritimatiellota bacterium]
MVQKEPLGEPGSASPFCMGYNFKLDWISAPEKDNPGFKLPPPEVKDPMSYDFLSRIRRAGYRITWPHYNSSRDEICTGTLPGLQRDYADGDWPTRSRIWKGYIDHVRTLTDFTGSKMRLASNGKGGMDSWPRQLYVRSARRMKGDYVMTQADVAGQTAISDSIGLGFYPVDLYPARLGVDADGTLVQEGGGIFLISPGPFPLSYRAITPKKKECENLLVPVCFSASHVAYASIRMEAQYMILGESAGMAAAQSLLERKAVQDIDIAQLQAKLRACGQKIAWDNKSNYRKYYRSFPGHVPVWWHAHPEEYVKNPPVDSDPSYVLVDDADAVKTGRWQSSTKEQPFIMEGYLQSGREGAGSKTVAFVANLRVGGDYNVYVSYIASKKRSRKVPIQIFHADGATRLLLDQTKTPGLDAGRFALVGRYRFEKGGLGKIIISTDGVDDGDVVADSILFTPVMK